MSKRKNPHIGSSLDDFLQEEGIYEEVTAKALKKVLAWKFAQAMKAQRVTKTTHGKEIFEAAWPVLAAGAAVFAIVKPFLGLSDRISRLEATSADYRSIAADLAELRSEVAHRQVYDAALQDWFR
jgi:hypothetical protein